MSSPGARIAIVGGGITGLAAAYHLRAGELSEGCEVHLFDSAATLGGVLQSEDIDGFRLEYGPDSMLSRLPWGVGLCQQLGLGDELIGASSAQGAVYVVHRGRLQRIPEGLALMAPQRIWPFVTTPILSWAGKLRLAAEPLLRRKTSGEDESLADFIRRRLGRQTFERLVQPLAGGIYMGDPERLSIRATFPQFVAMEENHGSLVRAARATAKQRPSGNGDSPNKPSSMFVAPRRGMRQLVDALEDQLKSGQVQIHSSTAVERLHRESSGGWAAEVVDAGGQRRRESFRGVIVATPANQSAPMLADVDPELSRLLNEIPYAGCVVVNLAYQRDAIPHALDSVGFVVPHVEHRHVLACTFCSVKYSERAPAGTALLRVFLGGGCRPETLDWPDDEVLRVVGVELKALLGIERSPMFSRIHRWRGAMPQYHLGHLDKVEQIDERVAQLPGLELAGNAFRGVGIPHCIHTGQQAVERLAAAIRETRPSLK